MFFSFLFAYLFSYSPALKNKERNRRNRLLHHITAEKKYATCVMQVPTENQVNTEVLHCLVSHIHGCQVQ